MLSGRGGVAAHASLQAAWDARSHCCMRMQNKRLVSLHALPDTANVEAPNVSSSSGAQWLNERGVRFTIGGIAFYRGESAQGRDLAVLAAALHKRRCGRLHVLDVMAGSGVRGARYAQQTGADLVWVNDIDRRLHDVQCTNLATAAGLHEPGSTAVPVGGSFHLAGLRDPVWQLQTGMEQTAQTANSTSEMQTQTDAGQNDSSLSSASQPHTLRVSHVDASRLLSACYLNEQYFDLIDIDSFGSESSHIGHAIDAVAYGGLLYLTSTDGFTSGGLRPGRSLAAYGAYARSLPFANEQGLRMLIGAAVKEGAARGVSLTPVFSLYSYHGPVFRVMLRAERRADWPVRHYGFVGYCHVHGNSYRVDWRNLSEATCRCCGGKPGSTPLVLAGPLWTGPLHDGKEVAAMAAEAAARGWVGHGVGESAADGKAWAMGARSKKNMPRPLEDVLGVMQEEAQEGLPVGYITQDAIAKHARTGSVPSKDTLLAALRAAGFVASRCHLDPKAIRTNARMDAIADVVNSACTR